MARTRRLRALGCGVVAALLMIACSTSEAPIATPQSNSPGDVTSILAQIRSSWVPTGPDSGGFRPIGGWDTPASLYATAWNLCLRAALAAPTPNLSPDQVANQLVALLQKNDPSLPPLQRAWLVARSFAWLGRPPPADQLRGVLATSRSGDLFTYSPAEPPNWSATETALEIGDAIDAPPPPEVALRAGASLAAATRGATPNNFLDGVLSLWMVADRVLPAADRAPLRNALAGVLQSQVARIGQRPDGVGLTVLAHIYGVANTDEIALPSLTSVSVRGLDTAQGYLSLSPGEGSADPQVTCVALGLGFKAGARLLDTLTRTAQPDGWRAWTADRPDMQSSLYSLLTLRGLGQSWNEGELRAQALRWLEALQLPASPTADQLQGLFLALAISRELQIPATGSVPGYITGLMRTAKPELDSWVLAVAALLGLSARPDAAVLARAAAAVPRTMAQTWNLALAAQLSSQAAWATQATDAARGLQAGALVFRSTPAAPFPDLLSTAAALQIMGVDPAARSSATAPFGTFPRYWIWPPSAGSGNLSDPQALYLGLLASGADRDSTGLMLAFLR